MKNQLIKFAGIFALSLLLSVSAHAVIIDLGVYPQPAGNVYPDSPQGELDFLNNVVLVNYPALPEATWGSNDIDGSGTSITINLTGQYDYIKLKWDHAWQYYYIAGETGDVIFNSTKFNENGQAQDLSHYTFFNGHGVPDGGTTAVLLGLGLVGLSFIARRRRLA